MNIPYLYSKILKKIRGASILNSEIHESSKVESGTSFINSKMSKYSFCGYDCEIMNTEIGSYCSIANNVIIGGAMHPLDWVSTSPVFYSGRDSVKMKFSTFDRPKDIVTTINHDVWIGQYCLIKQGVTIGTGAVIGMGSVLTKDVPPYEIWAGNPAKFLKKRFDEETIEKLLGGKWWDKSDEEMHIIANKIKEVKKFVNEL